MTRMTADGDYTVIASGFIAWADSEPSEGRGPRIEIGRFTTAEEAIAAVRGRGVQGDSGYVYAFEVRHYEGGLVREHTREVYGRRQTPEGSYQVGWLDLREYDHAPGAHDPRADPLASLWG